VTSFERICLIADLVADVWEQWSNVGQHQTDRLVLVRPTHASLHAPVLLNVTVTGMGLLATRAASAGVQRIVR